MPIRLMVFCLLIAGSAFADGVAMRGFDWSSLRLAEETEQVAVIDHRDGIERMVISIGFAADDAESALWVFPVPGNPAQTKVDVFDQFPRFHGRDPREETVQRLGLAFTIARASQIYPVFPLILLQSLGTRGSSVELFGQVEKWGIHAEVVTAGSGDDLSEYLAAKNGDTAVEDGSSTSALPQRVLQFGSRLDFVA